MIACERLMVESFGVLGKAEPPNWSLNRLNSPVESQQSHYAPGVGNNEHVVQGETRSLPEVPRFPWTPASPQGKLVRKVKCRYATPAPNPKCARS